MARVASGVMASGGPAASVSSTPLNKVISIAQLG
jgi:hypothetical protein